jgi:rfaE bifunctional protein kinase chain/domain
MNTVDVDAVFAGLRRARVAILGDFCLDHYLFIDSHWHETSVETGLPVIGVAREKYSPGGAGNVAANVAALGVPAVHCLGCLGDDPYGIALSDSLRRLGCDVSGFVVQPEGYTTRAYVKPIRDEKEDSRFDHGVANRISSETTRKIAAYLETLLPNLDAVVLNQQVTAGVWSEELFDAVNRLAARFPRVVFVADSRHHAARFRGIVMKLNAVEAARLAGREARDSDQVGETETDADLAKLFERFHAPVVVTRGAAGAVGHDAQGVHRVPGVHIVGETDTVGAGDTFCSALAACLGAGLGLPTALAVANWSASVTVRKLRQTGTANEAEIRAVAADADYVYAPELAARPNRARYLEGLDVETVTRRSLAQVRYVLFDHDGTISTLRQGWEEVMEPMMVRAIFGKRHGEADERAYARVVSAVRGYIDQSTGIATLQQMQALREMVKTFGFVPEREILDIHGYKAVYNEALMALVRDRLARLTRGERSVEDFVLKDAVPMLRALRARGIKLALASGTDQEDVLSEAQALGYADLFDGGIFGATREVTHCSKRVVVERILAQSGSSGEALLVCGDGPVELRLARKRGGIALGVASDEVRRYGWNPAKRARLIRAGADYLLPDWSQHARVFDALLGKG